MHGLVHHNRRTICYQFPKAWFPLDRNRIVKLCDSSRFWLIVETLSTIENKNPTEIGLDLQPKRLLSLTLTNLHTVS